MTLTVHTVVKHLPNNQSANFQAYRLKGNEDIEVKQSHLAKRAKQGKKHVFEGSPPGFNGLMPKSEYGHFRPKASWSTKSGNRGVKSGGTSPLGLIVEFRILRCRFQTHVGHVAFALTDPNCVNL